MDFRNPADFPRAYMSVMFPTPLTGETVREVVRQTIKSQGKDYLTYLETQFFHDQPVYAIQQACRWGHRNLRIVPTAGYPFINPEGFYPTLIVVSAKGSGGEPSYETVAAFTQLLHTTAQAWLDSHPSPPLG